ncbi:MAG TPA: ABC transporter permease [Bacillota bacterium]|nr:ABC transporter permease [Bacillota bacterium]
MAVAEAVASSPAPRRRRLQPSLAAGLVMLAVLVVVAVAAGRIAPYPPLAQSFSQALLPPSAQHLLGTDNYGRDVFSRVLAATRIDLEIGLLGTLFPFLLGSALGAIAGYAGGLADALIMRVVDVIIAFPFLVLVIAFVAFVGGGTANVVVALTIGGWVGFARLVRGEILVQRQMEYADATRLLGYSRSRILFRHLLPNAIPPALVFAVSSITLNILTAAALGFLGLGVSPPTPEWGLMMSEGETFLFQAWWIATMPGLACLFAGLTFTLLGDGASDLLRVRGQ